MLRVRSLLTLAVLAGALSSVPSATASEELGVAASRGGSGGQACGTNRTWVQTTAASANYSASADGVITSWSIGVNWGPAKLKIVRPAGSGSYTVVASDGPRESANGGIDSFPVRIPVRQGDTLGLHVASNTWCFVGSTGDVVSYSNGEPPGSFGMNGSLSNLRLPISATLEPDADGDGYGDETQDDCPTNGATFGPCPLPTMLGKTFLPHNNSCENATVFPLRSPGIVSAVQREGVITSWSHRTFAGASGTAQLRILQPLGGEEYLLRAQDVAHPVTPGALNTFKVRIPVRVGDRIAIAVTGDTVPACGVNSSAWQVGFGSNALAPGSSAIFPIDSGSDVDLSAYQEADADKDGYGDTTQDRCPTDASTQGTCPVKPPPVDAACQKAKSALRKAKAKLAKLKRSDAPAKKVKKAKKAVKRAKGKVRKAC